IVVGDATGGIEAENGRLTITARGRNVFGTSDDFYFVSRDLPGDGARPTLLSARVDELLDSRAYAKAGVMVRIGRAGEPSYAAAPFAMINVFPDGTVAFLQRDRVGGGANELKRFAG